MVWIRHGVNLIPELEFTVNSNSNSGIDYLKKVELELRNFELELNFFELELKFPTK